MAGKKRENIREEDITGLKYFDKLLPLFKPLHEVGCQRDKAGNRKLHYDQYCSLMLLFLFNPTVTSLRGLQQASQLKKVQRKLGCKRASLGSLSESVAVFDPELLKRIIEELGSKLQPVHNVARGHVKHVLTAVDGSVVKTLATITQAAYLKNCHGASKSAWRLHTHFDIDHHVPRRIDVTVGLNSGKTDEKNVLRKVLQPDHCYVMDRWYAEFRLLNDIHAMKSSYVCRVRDNSRYKILEERPLSKEARAAGIIFDGIVELGVTLKPERRPNHPVRLILIKTNPHTQRGKQPHRQDGPAERRHLADRHESCGRRSGGDHRRYFSTSLDGGDFLSVFQAHPRLPSLVEPKPGGYRDPGVHGDHRLHADQPLDGPQADASHIRDGLPLL